MARIDTLNNYLTDISLAIKEKRNITSDIPAKQFDEEIRKIQSGDGMKINGVLRNCKVAENNNISAGDFVEKKLSSATLSNLKYALNFSKEKYCDYLQLTDNEFCILSQTSDSGDGILRFYKLQEQSLILEYTISATSGYLLKKQDSIVIIQSYSESDKIVKIRIVKSFKKVRFYL